MEHKELNGEQFGAADQSANTVDEELIKEAEGLITPANAIILSDDHTKELSIKEMLVKLLEKKQTPTNIKPNEKPKKPAFQWPKLWNKKIEDNSNKNDLAVVIYLSQKGLIEEPKVVPIEAGNMVIIKGSPYEVDPRAFWLLKIGKNVHKVLLIKEIDRRPVSNLDIDEIRQRGDSTDSDSFLIKAALKEQSTLKDKKPVSKWLIIGIVIAVVIAVAAFFIFGGNGGDAAAAATNVIP